MLGNRKGQKGLCLIQKSFVPCFDLLPKAIWNGKTKITLV